MPTHARTRTIRSDPERLLLSFAASIREYALLLIDSDGCILSWNHGAEHLSGYPEHEVIGRHFSRIYAPDMSPQASWSVIWRLRRRAAGEDISERLRKDGTGFPGTYCHQHDR